MEEWVPYSSPYGTLCDSPYISFPHSLLAVRNGTTLQRPLTLSRPPPEDEVSIGPKRVWKGILWDLMREGKTLWEAWLELKRMEDGKLAHTGSSVSA